MKKLLSIFSAVCIALSLTGCAEEIPIEKLYFRIDDRIYCCAIADIISGSMKWHEPYNFEEFEPAAYNFDHLF